MGQFLDKQPAPMGEQTYEKYHFSLKIEKAEQPSHSGYLQLPTCFVKYFSADIPDRSLSYNARPLSSGLAKTEYMET